MAVRLALAWPDRVRRLLLAWPATAGDLIVDTRLRGDLTELGASPAVIDQLLTGQTLRGVTNAELTGIRIPVGVLPAVPDNRIHQRHTAMALRRLLEHADELPGCPEPLRPEFARHLEQFLGTVNRFVAG